MLSPRVLETFRPFVIRLSPVQRFELIRWIVNEVPFTEEESSTEPAQEAGDDRRMWEARISAEAVAWYARPDADRALYVGQYVAVLDGQVVEHDPDRIALYRRVRLHYPNIPVLITEAEARQPREFLILSPRLEPAPVTTEV